VGEKLKRADEEAVTKTNINFTTLRSSAIFAQKTLFSDIKKHKKRAKAKHEREEVLCIANS
jgi:hypothetical protein